MTKSVQALKRGLHIASPVLCSEPAADNELKCSAVSIVVDLLKSIETREQRDALTRSIHSRDNTSDVLAWRQVRLQAINVEGFSPIQL